MFSFYLSGSRLKQSKQKLSMYWSSQLALTQPPQSHLLPFSDFIQKGLQSGLVMACHLSSQLFFTEGFDSNEKDLG